jgi:hypothetical protein
MQHRCFLGPSLEPGPDWNEPVSRFRRDVLGPTYQAEWDREHLRALGLAGLNDDIERLSTELRDANRRIEQLSELKHLPGMCGFGPIRMERP